MSVDTRTGWSRRTYSRVTRLPIVHSTSYGSVSLPAAISSIGSVTPCCSPNSTTSSPTATSGTSLTSTMVRSIVTRPRIGTRLPPTSIWPLPESSQE